ncbi:MAG: hypothetical protein ACK47B_06340 [Armatimonadota bacterium]
MKNFRDPFLRLWLGGISSGIALVYAALDSSIPVTSRLSRVGICLLTIAGCVALYTWLSRTR